MYAEVRNCQVMTCFYNDSRICTARAITVGSEEPLCETFMSMEGSHSPRNGSALVGACHMGQCRHNVDFYCHAVDDIVVKMQGGKAFCETFEK